MNQITITADIIAGNGTAGTRPDCWNLSGVSGLFVPAVR